MGSGGRPCSKEGFLHSRETVCNSPVFGDFKTDRNPRFSVLPALSLDGILYLDILERSWTGEDVYGFIDSLLDHMNRWPQKNSVIVMDNASIHKVNGIQQLIENRYLFSFTLQ